MSRRTDSYQLVGSADQLRRMKDCDQVHPGTAIPILKRGLLVFGLCPDLKWRRVRLIALRRSSFTSPNSFRIVFASDPKLPPHYSRSFTKDGILLVEVPPTHFIDLTGD